MTKQYNYAIVHSGQSIQESGVKGFKTYEEFRESLEDYYDGISHRPYPYVIGNLPSQRLMYNIRENAPCPVASFIYTSDKPNDWVTKMFMTSIIVWTSEVEE